MTKFIMFFHEVLESYISAVQQITPIFAYMVSILYVVQMCCVCVCVCVRERDYVGETLVHFNDRDLLFS
jgi:hypothetical protein